MKKIIFTALTLMVLAGSTFTVSTVHAPNCQIDDPNGCGIFG
jgi:hypothetical protein